MKIIFIRHAEPNYELDTLTEKGWREAELLSERVKKWDVKDFYCSPLGRAQDTASLSLKKMNRTATTYEWLKEFYYPVHDPVTNRFSTPWDFMPEFFTYEETLYDRKKWYTADVFKENKELIPAYKEVCQKFDELLAGYGYVRQDDYYEVKQHSDDTIVIFCHLGVSMLIMGYLCGISPSILWQSFFMAPSSVTVLCSEERIMPKAFFRCQVLGDTTHLHDGGEPISQAGYFTEPFQG